MKSASVASSHFNLKNSYLFFDVLGLLLRGFSLVLASSYPLVAERGHVIVVPSLVVEHGPLGMWSPSWIRDETCVPCIGRRISNH